MVTWRLTNERKTLSFKEEGEDGKFKPVKRKKEKFRRSSVNFKHKGPYAVVKLF